jgi:hypothetical protein
MTTEPPAPRIPTVPLKGTIEASQEIADLIADHIRWSRWENCTHRKAGAERQILAASSARGFYTPTHNARWMPTGAGSLAPMSDVDLDMLRAYPQLDSREERVFGASIRDGVKLVVVPR